MLLAAEDGDMKLSDHISGVILNHETFHQSDDSGKAFTEVLKEQGVVPGIKVCNVFRFNCFKFDACSQIVSCEN